VIAGFLRKRSPGRHWGGDGKVERCFAGGSSCDGVALQTDGKIIVARQQIDPSSFAMLRYVP
jgi:hypothetical protein